VLRILKTGEYFMGYALGTLHWSKNPNDAITVSEKEVDGFIALCKEGGFNQDLSELVKEPAPAEIQCANCDDKGYVISDRNELFIVERCDECSNISDEDAAELARNDGINCCTTPPYYIELTPDMIDKYTILRENPRDIRKLFYMIYQINWVTSRSYSMNDYDEEHGFNGECWVCFDEFCNNELLDKEYMQSILHDEDFEKWLDWELAQKGMTRSSVFSNKKK
jgi:hypothetical protein